VCPGIVLLPGRFAVGDEEFLAGGQARGVSDVWISIEDILHRDVVIAGDFPQCFAGDNSVIIALRVINVRAGGRAGAHDGRS